MFSFVADLASNLAGQMFADERQEDAQQFQEGQNAWQQHMRRTQYQDTVHSMKEAGLNPMLAYHQGGGATPSGGNPGAAGSPHMTAPSASLQNAAQVKLIDAQADKSKAEADEIRARTPTHGVTRELMGQQIRESTQRIEKMIQEIKTSTASAANIEQQTRNLQQQIPHIQATIRQLQESTKLTIEQARHEWGKADLTHAQMQEIRQRVQQNLPELTRLLHELESKARGAELPAKEKAGMVHSDPFLGTLSALLRALNPLAGLIGVMK